ncbi:MAG: transglycosylase SLT domain-containing protein [Bacteroidales bacterium]|nr:transglycosylase SLT domain-containing protein [Bacteroidales bacterium]
MEDSTDLIVDEKTLIGENIDSLFALWYIKNTIESNEMQQEVAASSGPIYFSDSVYAECLAKIPTTFPLVYNQDVKSWIEMYLRRGKYLIPSLLGLGQYYFPMIEPVLDQYDIPLELKYLTIVESALNPRAVSRTGATGLWQFMYATGKMYGLNVNSLVDERRDPAKETVVAAQFLRDLYKIYGDWALVIAAYNCGPGNVNKAIRRSGGRTNFWEIYQYLPRETRGYVPAFISVNYIMTNYKQHGYSPVKVNMPSYHDTVMVTNKLHFGQVEGVLGVSIEMLRELNPQYKKDIVPGDIAPAPLRLPDDCSAKFVEQEKEIYAFKDSIFFAPSVNYEVVAQQAYVASQRSGYRYDPEPCDASIPAGTSKLTYTVKSGDTFGFIANWYDVKLAKLKCWNNIESNKLSIGQKLVVYVPTKKLNSYKNVDNMTFAEKQAMSSNNIVSQSKNSGKPLDNRFEYYTIKKGDNLSTIASRYPGISDTDIMNINGFTAADVRRLQIGQIIKIRKK